MSGTNDPWAAFRTGGTTEGPAAADPWAAYRVPSAKPEDPARAETRAANGTFGGMLSGGKRAVESGYTFGLRDEAQAFADGVVNSGVTGVRNMLGGRAPAFGDTYSKTYDESLGRERKQTKEFAEDSPVISTAGNLVGGVAVPGGMGSGFIRGGGALATGMGGTAAAVGRGVVAGGVGGAASGFGEGEGGFNSRLGSAATGGVVGGLAGGALAGGANLAIGAGRRLANASGMRNPDAMAERLILRNMERDATPQGRSVDTELDRVGAQLDPNRGMAGPGLPARTDDMILPDVGGENLSSLAAVAARTPSASKQAAADAVVARRGASPERIAGAVDDGFGGGGGTRVADEVGALREQRTREAAPLYERAFEKRVPETVQARIDPLVSSPEGQTALGHAVTILEREGRAAHLRSGDEADLFDPASMGLVRANEDGGWMLEGGMRNMRLVDAVKRGMDEMLETHRDPVTLRLPNTQAVRALDDQRRAYVEYLRGHPHLQPYARALDAWAGPSRSLDAVTQGRQTLKLDRDVVAGIVQRMQPADMEFFRLGVGRAITDATSDPKRAPDFARKMLEDRQMQERLRHAIPDPAQRAQFAAAMQREVKIRDTNHAINPRAGSPTQPLQAAAADMELDPVNGVVQGMLDAGERGGMWAAGTRGLRNLYSRGQGINSGTADALAQRLFSTDPTHQQALVQALQQRRAGDIAGVQRGQAMARPILNTLGISAGLASGGGPTMTEERRAELARQLAR